jgi:diguanylate cyclase (GGDEF)-like protein
VTVALGAVAWTVAIGPSAAEAPGGRLAALVGGLYPALDLTCLAALGWVVMRHGQRSPVWLRWVVLALALQTSAGLAYLLSALHGHDVALTAAVAYMAAGWAWVCAGVARCRAPQRSWAAGAHNRPPVWSETLPFAVGCAVIALAVALPDPAVRVAGAVAGGLMAVRAIAALRVNRGLISERDRLLVTDPLTGAFNRRFLQTEAARAFARASRGEESLSAIAFDLDRFKEVNDRFGHLGGDAVLKRVAAELRLLVRETDFLGRFGGEEFLIVLPETTLEGGRTLAEKARKRIEELEIRLDGGETVTLTLSAGVASRADVRGESRIRSRALIAAADEALYAAKNAGRNRVELAAAAR